MGLGGRSSPVPGLDDGELSFHRSILFCCLAEGPSLICVVTIRYWSEGSADTKSDFFHEFLCSDD